jgi:hypothetical protein
MLLFRVQPRRCPDTQTDKRNNAGADHAGTNDGSARIRDAREFVKTHEFVSIREFVPEHELVQMRVVQRPEFQTQLLFAIVK